VRSPAPRIVLASASPRRRELLASAGFRFDVAPVDVDEALESFGDPLVAAETLAVRKARAAALDSRLCGDLFVGADTVVALPDRGAWRLLGKPADEADAERMLRALSGCRHAVATGVAVARRCDGALFHGVERTWVTMRPWTGAELAGYVASREWEGKAGAYAIQESADRFVTALEAGGFDNVVGLPVALTLRLLREAGAPT
jgi:septum formation protein